MFDTPIALFIYNRTKKTKIILDSINKMNPKKIFIIADGPKNSLDKFNCYLTKQQISKFDWAETEIVEYFSKSNLGCAKRISSGIDFIFNNVNKCIILEDDCLPNESFFRFMEKMLNEYENDEKIMHISGTNLIGPLTKNINEDYFFSNYCIPPWGWATWKKSWNKYDLFSKQWFKNKSHFKKKLGIDYSYWNKKITENNNTLKTWDIQWNIAIWANDGYSIIPKYNLVKNIGFGRGSTHTHKDDNEYSKLKRNSLSFKKKKPKKVITFGNEMSKELIKFVDSIS